MNAPVAIAGYAFSGSLCRIRKFETMDGNRYCITIFNLSDYKHLHFAHDEYKWIICKLHMLLSTQTIYSTCTNTSTINKSRVQFNIRQIPFNGDFKIKFGKQNFTIGLVTAFGLVKTTPFVDIDVSSVSKMCFTCDSNWDICICETCSVFRRMCDFEASAREFFSHPKPVNVVFTSPNAE